MKLVSTSDVSSEKLYELKEVLQPDIDVDIQDGKVVLLSAEPPSWIHFIASTDWWIQGFSAMSALYVAEIVKEAAKDTWKNRSKVVAAAVGSINKIKTFSEKIINFKSSIKNNTELVLVLPVPHELRGCCLLLNAEDPDVLSLQLALYVHHLPRVEELIRSKVSGPNEVATGVVLSLLSSGALQVCWLDCPSLESQVHVLEVELNNT
ncbi:hypothetical protein OL229_00060 [Neisseriaceae bacterium JH1-16]|nr:hypothetical protein [Neisseriaceae bacterium JH1-16]